MGLEELRRKIDAVDEELAGLLEKRMQLVEQVAEVKKRTNAPVLHTAREQEILRRIRERGGHAELIESVYRYLFEVSRARQSARLGAELPLDWTGYEKKTQDGPEITVACQGVEGAYSAIAKAALFPGSRTAFYPTWEDVTRAVQEGQADYGVVPTHNSNAGSVLEVYDLLAKYDVYIVNSHKLKVTHCLLGPAGADVRDVRTVYSHPQGLAQCRRYVEETLHAEAKLSANTALAAEYVARLADPHTAALASAECAALYGLSVLQTDVQDSPFNYTNFVVLAQRPNRSEQNGRISIIASLPHETGTLYQLLTKFYINNLNLTKLESRPIQGRDFEYLFYLDFEGNVLNQNVSSMLAALKEELPYFRFLGNY